MKTGSIHRNVRYFLKTIFSQVFLIKMREASMLFNDDTEGDYEYPPKCKTARTELHLPCPSCGRATELRFPASHPNALICAPWRTQQELPRLLSKLVSEAPPQMLREIF